MKAVTIDKVLSIINSNIENIDLSYEQVEADLTELGMDSISFIRIIVDVEENFECEIPDSKLLITELNSVKKIYEELQLLYYETESNSAHE